MKILFFISSLENSGAERAMSNITTHLPEGVEADILLNSVSDHDFPTDANIISLGMQPNCKKDLKYQLIAFGKRIPKLYQLKKKNHYDACISFMDSANICNILTGRKYCKTIVSVRVKIAQDKSFAYQYIVKPLASLLYNRADYVVAVAEGVRRELIDTMKIKETHVKTITNGYDVQVIEEQANRDADIEWKRFEGKFVFATSGRYSYQKAQWHLIRAFSRVAEVCDNACLLLMGYGQEEKYLREMIEAMGLKERVILLPYQRNPFAILKKCDVFVMPSMFEGYCNALCEAMICGLPCIATDFQSSAREILAPETDYQYQLMDGIEYASYGILTPVCSGTRYKGLEPLEKQEDDLAKAMITLYQDSGLLRHYKEQALERGKQLDINTKVREWLTLVEE